MSNLFDEYNLPPGAIIDRPFLGPLTEKQASFAEAQRRAGEVAMDGFNRYAAMSRRERAEFDLQKAVDRYWEAANDE